MGLVNPCANALLMASTSPTDISVRGETFWLAVWCVGRGKWRGKRGSGEGGTEWKGFRVLYLGFRV